MSYILFIFYFLLCSWILTKNRFVRNSGLGNKIIVAIFFLKIIAGVFNGWAMSRTSYLSDTWSFHKDGLIEYHLLFSNPKEYFLNFFHSNYGTEYGGFFQSNQSYWNDLRDALMGKLLSVFDIFSFGNYYINVIFFNFIIIFGNIGLFRVFKQIYPAGKKVLIVSCFLLPSLLLYSSEIHREGLILALIGIIVFNIYYALNYTGFTLRRVIYILFSVCLIFFLRNYIVIMLMPAITAWIIAHKRKKAGLLIFIIVYILSTIVFFNVDVISSRLRLPEKIIERQQSFLSLPKATTQLPLNILQPTFKSFVENFPQAIDHSFLHPYLADIRSAKFLTPFALEIILYQLVFVVFIFFYIKNRKSLESVDPFVWFGLFLSLSVFIIIGYTIPVTGAIIRYRAIYFPFLLSPVLCSLSFKFLKDKKSN